MATPDLQNHPPCVVCQHDSFKKMGQWQQYKLLHCQHCGVRILHPKPNDVVLKKTYDSYIQKLGFDRVQTTVHDIKRQTFEGYLKKVLPFVSSGHLLDVGCSTGELLDVFSKQFDGYGIEIAPLAYEKCVQRFGKHKIQSTYLEKGDFDPSFFDLITLTDVFEHIKDPVKLLNILKEILKPGGYLMITTPDTSSLSQKIMGLRWPHYKEEHLFYYNRHNLTQFFLKDFEIITIESARKTLNLQYCMDVLKATHSNKYKNTTQWLARLPKLIKEHHFKIYTGEMFALMKRKTYAS